MSRGREYRTGLIITGDASGGIRAIRATEGELGKLNTRFDSSSRYSRQLGTDAVRTGQQLKEIDRGATDASRGLSLVQRAATLAMAAFSIRQLGAYADGWSDLNSRILNTTKDVELSDHTMQRLAETARGTYSSLNQTAEAYLNNATTLTELGYSTERQLDLSDALNNALVISATRGQQAESVMNALSKAFAAGELRGDNFNTVIQSGGRIAEALAAGLGVATIELREMAAAGELTTARVFDALTSQMQVLRQEAEDMPATIADGWTLIGNASMELVGRLDRAAGASERVATLMIGAADGITASIDPLIENLDTLQDIATLVAVVVGGRYAASMAAATSSTVQKIIVDRTHTAALLESQAAEARRATMAARATAAEQSTAAARATIAAQRAAQHTAAMAQDVQRVQSLQATLAAERALAAQRLQEQATAAGRMQVQARIAQLQTAEAAASNQLTAASVRLTQAQTAEAAAKRTSALASMDKARADTAATAAAGRYTVAAHAAATANGVFATTARAAAGALALVGGPFGAAVIAGFGLYYFREELGLTDEKMQGTIDTVGDLGASFVSEFKGVGAELSTGFRGVRAELIELDASFFDLKASAVESFSGIVDSSTSVINLGLIPLQNAVNALDSTFAGLIYRVANGLESAGAMPFGMQNVFGEQVSRLRGMADGLMDGLIEPIGISTDVLESNSQALRNQANALRESAAEIRGNAIPANADLVVTYQTIDQWLDQIERAARSTGNSISSNAPSAATLEAWGQYNDRLRENIAAQRDGGSAIGAAGRALDAMGDGVNSVMRGYSIFLAVQEEALKDNVKAQREAATAAQQAARAQASAAQQAARAAEQAAKQQADALRSIQHEMDPLLAEHATYIERLGVLDKALADGTLTQEAYGETVRWAAAQYARAATGADDYEKQTASLVSTYDRHNQRAAELQNALRDINERYRAGVIDGEQYLRMVAGVRKEMADLALEADPAAQDMARAWEEAGNRIDETFADAFRGAFDSFESFSDQLLNGFKRLLAELAYQATLRPIVVGFTQDMQGLMSGGRGGFGNTIGAARSLFSSGSSLLGGGAAAGGLYASANTGAAAGGLYGNIATSAATSTGIMSSITAGVSAAMPWIAGGLALDSLLGGGITKAIGGIFGGSWKTQDGGLNLGVSGGDITGNQYEQQRRSGGLFRRSRSRTITSGLDGELQAMLQQAYSAQEQSLAFTLEVLGQQSSALNAFSSGLTQISTQGKSEAEVEQAVQEWLQGIVNRAAQSVVDPSQYAMAGETTVETLNRLATALTGVNPLLEQLHDFTYEASLSGGAAAAHLLELAGGLDALAARTQYYYDNILTEAQRHEISMNRATQAMAAFTAQTGHIINSTDQLYELVEGIDRNTEAGRALYVAALDLAPALVEVEKGLERVRDRFEDMLRDAESALSSAEQQARSAWQAFDNQAYRQQLTLLGLMGDEQGALALQRERELQSIDPLLHETQRRIWAMQDETAAQNEATQAAQRYISELSRVRDQLASSLGSISQWVDQQRATGSAPGANLGEAQAQFARQLVLAESGDRNALQSITQYADQVLQANDAYNASSAAGQRVRDDVLAALEGLPDSISDAQFIVDGFRDVVSSDMAREIERAIFSSRYKIDTLIEFAANATDLPADLRTILGEQAHRLDSTINYLLGENQLDAELRQLALLATNNLVATVDYITGSTLSTSDKMLALSSSNIMTAVIDFVLGSDIDRASRVLALESSNKYTSMIDMILGRDIHPDDRRLALDSTHRYASLIDYVVRSELTGGNRRLALSSLNEYDALIDYATRTDITSDDRRLALDNGNRYLSTMDYIVGRDIDDGSKEMALMSSNRYLSIINFTLGSDISRADRTLALESANRFDAVVRYVVDSPLTGGDRRLALSAGQHYEALIGYYVDKDVSRQDRQLALNSGNQYLSMIDLVLGKNLSADNRRLALSSNNRFVSIIDTVIGKQITGGDRRLALNSTNLYTTIVDAVFANGISADVRTLALSNTNAIMATIDGVLARNMDGDVKTLALQKSNTFLTTLHTALADGRLSADERRVLDAKSESIVKTLRTGGNLNLSADEWAVINAASGSRRLELLADVAFGRTDLDHLADIDNNTKPLAEQARDQLKELTGLVGEMSRTTDQFVGLNSNIVSLRDSINALGVAQAEVARIERERAAAEKAERDRIERERQATRLVAQAASVQSKIDEFYGLAEQTGRNANDNVDRYRSYGWITGDQGEFVSRIASWTQQSQMAAWTARRLELAGGRERELERMRQEYRSLTGSLAPFAEGGYTGPGGKYQPKGIVHAGEIVWSQADIARFGGVGVVESLRTGAIPAAAPQLPMPALPNFPLLNRNDQHELMRDLLNENRQLRKELSARLDKIEKHGAAGVAVQQEAAKQQIQELKKSNEALGGLSANARLEASR
ncbi:hypothetical protein CLM76_09445 [Vreelandella venusta]|nr:hypothetical protein CLM76_09445 [Halomonas hydrothermalis]